MTKTNVTPPKAYRLFSKKHPSVIKAYEAFGSACHQGGPLDAPTRELVKLGIALGAGLKSATKAHVRLARDAGVKPDAIRHAVLLTATTIGFPAMMRGMSWTDEELAAGR